MLFRNYLQQKNIIPKTIHRHEQEINKYHTWLQTLDIEAIQATTKDILHYLQHIKEKRQLCNATQNQLLQVLKNYYHYLAATQAIKNPTQFIKIRGAHKKHIQQTLTPEQIDMLCDAYYNHIQYYNATNKEIRFYSNQQHLLLGYYISLSLVAYQALTIIEILALTKTSFDIRKGTVSIAPHLKGNARSLSLEASQIGSIIEFYSHNTQALLMINKNHFDKLTITLKTFLPTYKNFRQLRASKIVQWIQQYGLRKAQVLAGHKNIKSTEAYLSNDIQSLQNDMNNFHPLQ